MTGLVLVLGLGEPASVAALVLARAGYPVALATDTAPRAHRRLMAFSDAWWDGEARLDGATAAMADPGEAVQGGMIPIYRLTLAQAVQSLFVSILVDARLAKREAQPDLRALAPLTIGCGPGHAAAQTCHIAIETQWGPDLGRPRLTGATNALGGEPRAIDGVGRERMVYAPVAGLLTTSHAIGDAVTAGAVVAHIGDTPIKAPIAGTIRGLMRPGLTIRPGDKLLEVDPRPPATAVFRGIGLRPKTIAEGVLSALTGAEALSRSPISRKGAPA